MSALLLAPLGCGCDSPPKAEPRAATPAAAAAPLLPTPSVAPDAVREGRAAGLRYLELAPAAQQENEARPLIVFVHGRGDRAHTDWLHGLTPLRARFVFPEAPERWREGFSWFRFSVSEGDPALLAQDIRARAEQLAAAIAAIARKRPTRGKPIVVGFSQGAMLSFALSVLHPELISAALPISGLLPGPLLEGVPRSGVRYPPIRALHGTSDRLVPFEPTAQLIATLKARGLDAELQAFPGTGHQITPAMYVALDQRLHEAFERVSATPSTGAN